MCIRYSNLHHIGTFSGTKNVDTQFEFPRQYSIYRDKCSIIDPDENGFSMFTYMYFLSFYSNSHSCCLNTSRENARFTPEDEISVQNFSAQVCVKSNTCFMQSYFKRYIRLSFFTCR